MGSSHQNVKQILLKLEKKGFVCVSVDEQDTPYCQVVSIFTIRSKNLMVKSKVNELDKGVNDMFVGVFL